MSSPGARRTGTTRAITHLWHDDEGWGVVESPDTPGGCWVHISHLDMPGYRHLEPGQRVHLTWETPGHGRYAYRAVHVLVDEEPEAP